VGGLLSSPFIISSALEAPTAIKIITGIVSIPGAIVLGLGAGSLLLGSWMIQRSRALMRDPPTRMYIHLLKQVLYLLGEDPSAFLEEVPSLEDAVMARLCAITLQAEPEGKLSCLDLKDLEQIFSKLVSLREKELKDLSKKAKKAQSGHHSYFSFIDRFTQLSQKSKKELYVWLAIIGRLQKIRKSLEKSIFLSFVGVHNSGKSTFLQKLFGIETNPDVLKRTEKATLYPLEKNPAEEEVWKEDLSSEVGTNVSLYAVDFPGSSDERQFVAKVADMLGSVTTLFVVILTAGHIAKPEKEVIEMVKKKNSDFVVFINKAETVPEIRGNEEQFREDYAGRLGISKEVIFLTTALEDQWVEKARSIIFTRLTLFAPNSEENLAIQMLHKDTREEICKCKPSASKAAVSKVVHQMMINAQKVTPEGVSSSLSGPRYSSSTISSKRELSSSGGDLLPRLRALFLEPLEAMGFPSEVVLLILSQKFEDGTSLPGAKKAISLLEEQSLTSSTVASSMMPHLLDLALHVENLVRKVAQETALERSAVIQAAVQLVKQKIPLEEEALKQESRKKNRLSKALSFSSSTLQIPPPEFLPVDIEHLRYVVRGKAIPGADPPRPNQLFPNFSPSLDFPERLALFRKKIGEMRRLTEERAIAVEEGNELISLINQVMDLSQEQLRKTHFRITIQDSPAIDVNGVFRGIMTVAAKQLTEGLIPGFFRNENGFVYFCAVEDGMNPFWFRAIGRVIGLVLANPENVYFPVAFPPVVFKIILGQVLELNDLETFEPDLARNIKLTFFYEPEELEDLGLTFPDDSSHPGETVNAQNRMSYLRYLVRRHLGLFLPLSEFVLGIQDVIPPQPLCVFTPQMLQMALCGNKAYSAEDLRDNADTSSSQGNQQQLNWLWEVVEEMNEEDRTLLLIFTTGSVSPPPGGFAQLDPPFKIVILADEIDRLPVSQTCFNMLIMPKYGSKELLQERLLFAIRNTGAGHYGMQ